LSIHLLTSVTQGEDLRQFLQHKLIEPEQLEKLRAAMATWFKHPGAFLARTWCEAVGRKP
jgi:hypothetical protein